MSDMNSEIAAYDFPHEEVHPQCHKIIRLGVQFIANEFRTSIRYEVRHSREERKIAFVLLNVAQQEWQRDPGVKEIIEHKLRTHFKIALDNFYELSA